MGGMGGEWVWGEGAMERRGGQGGCEGGAMSSAKENQVWEEARRRMVKRRAKGMIPFGENKRG